MATTPVKDKSSTKHRSAKGTATTEAMDTTASHVLNHGPLNMATASAKDNSATKQSSAKGVTISHHEQRGLPNMASASPKNNSSSKQRRRAKEIKREQANLANLKMDDASSNKALINFGR